MPRQTACSWRGDSEHVESRAVVGELDSGQVEVVTDRKHTTETVFFDERQRVRDGFVGAEAEFINQNVVSRNAHFDGESLHRGRLVSLTRSGAAGHDQIPAQASAVEFNAATDSLDESLRWFAITIHMAAKDDRHISGASVVGPPETENLE